MGEFHRRIMSIPCDSRLAPKSGCIDAYATGHRDARYAAAEIAAEADNLRARAEAAEVERDKWHEWAGKLAETLMVVNAQHGGRNAARLLKDYRDFLAALRNGEGGE